MFLREEPAGRIIPGALPEGAPIWILYDRQVIDGVEWIHVRDTLSRIGWLRADVLVIYP